MTFLDSKSKKKVIDEKLDTYEKLPNNQLLLKLCLYHRNVLNLYFSQENNKFIVQILRNIDKYKSFSVNWESVITRHIIKMYTKYDSVFYLNLKFWQFFNKIDSAEYVMQFLLRLDLFQMKNMTSNRKNICYEKWQIL